MIDDEGSAASFPDHFASPASGDLPPHTLLPAPVGLPPINVEARDLATGRVVYVTSGLPLDTHVRLLDSDLEFGQTIRDTFTVVEGDPLSAEAKTDVHLWLRRDDWHARVETSSTMSATEDEFLVSNDLQAYEGNTRVYAERLVFANSQRPRVETARTAMMATSSEMASRLRAEKSKDSQMNHINET